MLQPRRVTLLAEPVAEAIRGERFAERRDEEGQVAGGRGGDDYLQFGQDRDGEGDGLAVAVLCLGQSDPALLDVLRAEPDDVRPPLPGIEHERQRQSRLAADRVILLELPDLFHRPGMEAVAFGLEVGHVAGRVALRQLVLDGKSIDLPQRLDEAVRRFGPVGHLVAHPPNMAGFHERVGLRSVLLANPVEDAAPDILGPVAQPLVFGRDVVLLAEPLEAAPRATPLQGPRSGARRRAYHRGAVLGDESVGSGLTVKTHLPVPGTPQVDAHVAVPVRVFDDVFQAHAARAVSHEECWHGCALPFVSRQSSQGLWSN